MFKEPPEQRLEDPLMNLRLVQFVLYIVDPIVKYLFHGALLLFAEIPLGRLGAAHVFKTPA